MIGNESIHSPAPTVANSITIDPDVINQTSLINESLYLGCLSSRTFLSFDQCYRGRQYKIYQYTIKCELPDQELWLFRRVSR